MDTIKPTVVMGNNIIDRFQRLCYLIRQLPKSGSVLIHHPNDLIKAAFEDYMDDHKVVFECTAVKFSPMMTTNTLPKAVALHPETAEPDLAHVFLGLDSTMLLSQRVMAGVFDTYEVVVLDVAFNKVTINAMFDDYAILING